MEIKDINLPRKLFPIKETASRNPGITESQLRKYVFTNQGGFEDQVVLRFGRKVLIDEDRLYSWLENNKI